jgi:hypothetical protein
MEKTASRLQDNNPVTGPASAVVQCARALATTGIAAGTWFGYSPLTRIFDAGQGLRSAEELAEFQAALGYHVARLGESLVPPCPSYVSTLLRFAEQVCLPPEQIEKILEYMTSMYAKRPTPSPVTEAIRSRLAARKNRQELKFAATLAAPLERQRFRAGMAEAVRASVCLVTLGLPCVPWKMLNRWGLRPESDFATGFSPFSLARHRVPGVIDALASDFSHYCRPDEIMMVKTMSGVHVPARKDRGVLWTHNRGAHWANDNFAPLIENLTWKIANFRAACRRPNPVFVMSNLTEEFPDTPLPFLPALQDALRRQTGRQENWLILTNQATSANGSSLHRVDDTTLFIRCPYPIKGYVWNDDENFDSPEGFAYEQTYISFICKALHELGLIERGSTSEPCDGRMGPLP